MPDNIDLIQSLQEVICVLHKCQAVHVETVRVKEAFQGKTIWTGNVEIYQLKGHPKANRCFAWLHKEDKSRRYVAWLESRAIHSPEMAVRAEIAFGSPETSPAALDR